LPPRVMRHIGDFGRGLRSAPPSVAITMYKQRGRLERMRRDGKVPTCVSREVTVTASAPKLRDANEGIVSRWSAGVMAFLTAAVLLVRIVLAEEAMTSRSHFPAVSRPEGLRAQDKEYLTWVERFISWKSHSAQTRLWRYYAMMITAALSALGVSLVIALSLPNWVPAALGFVSSGALVVQLILQDQKLGMVDHTTAVRVQKALREFRFGLDEDDSWATRQRFEEFRKTVESIKEREGAKSLKIMGAEPPLPRSIQ
jgi:hypothetical protein